MTAYERYVDQYKSMAAIVIAAIDSLKAYRGMIEGMVEDFPHARDKIEAEVRKLDDMIADLETWELDPGLGNSLK